MHESRSRKILRIDQSDGRGFEDYCADLGPYADELERFQRLNSFAYACSTDRKLFRELLFRRQSLARLDLPFSDQIEDVGDYLGSNCLSSNQAVPPELLTVQGQGPAHTIALLCGASFEVSAYLG